MQKYQDARDAAKTLLALGYISVFTNLLIFCYLFLAADRIALMSALKALSLNPISQFCFGVTCSGFGFGLYNLKKAKRIRPD